MEHLDIRVKEDLLRYERAQKKDMWFVMTTLHAAYFYPTWNRANVAWKVQGKWFEVHPGEIPPCFTALQIEEYCSRKCGYPKVNSTIDPVEEVEHQSGQTQPQQLVTLESCQLPCLEDKSTQTQHTGAPKYKELQNSVTSLRQDVSTEKYQTAKKTSECCELRRKLKVKGTAVTAATQTTASDTTQSRAEYTQTDLVFDSKGAASGLDLSVVQFESTVGVNLEIPAALWTATSKLDSAYQQQLGEREAEILRLRCSLKESVDLDIHGQSVVVPEAFAPYAEQLDVLYTDMLHKAVAEIGAMRVGCSLVRRLRSSSGNSPAQCTKALNSTYFSQCSSSLK